MICNAVFVTVCRRERGRVRPILILKWHYIIKFKSARMRPLQHRFEDPMTKIGDLHDLISISS